MLNANIPLNTQTPTRQYPWWVGVFLGIFLVSFFLGFSCAKRVLEGIRVPRLTTSSGVALRITPEHALWIKQHTEGLSLNGECPLDLPTLIAFKRPSWILIGDSGEEQLSFIGAFPKELENYQTAFGCTFTQNASGFTLTPVGAGLKPAITTPHTPPPTPISFTFPLAIPDGWAWINDDRIPLTLQEHGLSIALHSTTPNKKIPWPQENLTNALPLVPLSENVLSAQWQGLSHVLSSQNGVAFFSWTHENVDAFGIVLHEQITDEDFLNLISDIGNIPQTSQKTYRDDGDAYLAIVKEAISVTSLGTKEKEARLTDGTAVGFLLIQNGYSLISTVPTTWKDTTPPWEANLRSTQQQQAHSPSTLADFGKHMFTTKKTVTIFDK